MYKDIHILIVDDDPNMRLTLSEILSEEGYKITAAATSGVFKKELGRKFYNIALIDLILPNGSGIELIKEAKKANEETMVIVFTGFASLESAVSAMNEGAFSYLQKPVNVDELKITIKKALKMQRLSLDNKGLLIGLQEKINEIERLYKLKSEFTSMVTHELRTPLAAIKEGIDLVWDGSSGKINKEQKGFLEIAKRNVDRLAHLINQVLDFSKLTSPQVGLKIEETSINTIIDSAVSAYKLVIEKKGLFITVKTDTTKGIVVELDADRISQVLINLIDNAVKFTDKGGITVFTQIDKPVNLLKIWVQDTGIGIRQEDIPRLFQPFVQVGDKKDRLAGSTGLGLAICKEIIRQLDGKIWVESEFGKGSRFGFSLPLKA